MSRTRSTSLWPRGRRRQLKLRQCEVAQAAQVGREWLVDFEHGKPTLELAKVLRTLATLGVDVEVHMNRPPAWTVPLTGSRDAPPPEACRVAAEVQPEEGPGGSDATGGLAGVGALVISMDIDRPSITYRGVA